MLIRELVTRFGFDVDQQALRTINDQIGKITAGLGIAGAAALAIPISLVRSTMETQQALGELASLGVKDLALLDDAARRFSNRFAGTTKAQFIQAAYDVRSAISTMTDEQVAGFTAVAAMTAKATKATVNEMVGLFTTGYGIFKSQYDKLTDLEFGEALSGGIAQSVQQFKTTGTGMEGAIRSLGATAAVANVPMGEQLAILGSLQQTMPGAEAGTLYKAFILNAGKAGKALNLAFIGQDGRLKNILEIIAELRKEFPDLSDAAASMKIKEAFGSDEAYRFVAQLAGQTDALAAGIQSVNDAIDRGPRTAKTMADAINQGPKAAFDILAQQLQNLREELGKPLLPGAAKVFEFLGGSAEADGLIVQLQEFVKTHPNVSAGINAVLVGFGLLFSGLSAVLVPIAALSIAWPTITAGAILLKGALAFLLIPLTALASWLGISAIATLGLIALFPLLFAAFMLFADDVINWVQGNKSLLGEYLGDWESFGDDLLNFFADIGLKIDKFWRGVWDGITGAFSTGARTALGAVTGLLDYIPGVSAFTGAMGAGPGGAVDPSSMRPVNGGGTSNNVTVNANVQIPPGTTPEAARDFREGAKVFGDTAASDLSRFIANGRNDFARVE